MDLYLAPGHVYVVNPTLDFEAAKQQAIDKRLSVVAGGLGALFSRPKAEEVDLSYAETRFEPVWHVVCTVRFAFERNRTFSVPVTGPEVRSVSMFGQDFELAAQPPAQSGLLQQLGISGTARSFNVPGVERCLDENRLERMLDAVSGQAATIGAEIALKEKTEITDLSMLTSGEALLVSPQLSASQVLKPLLTAMIKPIQADKVIEEMARVDTLDLYFRPIYAFEFSWKAKNKTGVAEFNAITGAMDNGKALHTQSEKVLTRETLFDVTADNVTSLMPSATINVRLIPG